MEIKRKIHNLLGEEAISTIACVGLFILTLGTVGVLFSIPTSIFIMGSFYSIGILILVYCISRQTFFDIRNEKERREKIFAKMAKTKISTVDRSVDINV